jgi:hypothetical protein
MVSNAFLDPELIHRIVAVREGAGEGEDEVLPDLVPL